MAYLIIVLVLLVIASGIFYFMPSRREREISRLRLEAHKEGIEVSVLMIPDVNAPAMERITPGGLKREPKLRCVSWAKRYPAEHGVVPCWRLYESKNDRGPVPKTQLENVASEKEIELSKDYWIKIAELKSRLPQRLIALECSNNMVRWLGYERLDSSTVEQFVNNLSTELNQLMELNMAQSPIEQFELPDIEH